MFRNGASIILVVALAIILTTETAGRRLSTRFPDLSCYNGFDEDRFRQLEENCDFDVYVFTERPFGIPPRGYEDHYKCYKLCMMGFTFPFLEYGPETPNDWLGVSRRVYRFREYTNSEYFGDRDLFGLVLNDNQTENGDIGLRLYQKLKANCEELLNQYANGAEITKCDQWEPFYDCVAEAIKC